MPAFSQMSLGFYWFHQIGEKNQMQTRSSTDQGQRVLKTWENGFPHSHLWASYSLSLNAVQKKTINSTLKFSIRRRVKLWDNCLDLINKRNGSNSWPRTGEQQLEVHIWMGFTFNHHRTEWTEWTAEVTKLTRTKMFFLPFLLWMHSLYEQFVFCF